MTLVLTEEHADKLVRYLKEHTALDLPQKWLAELRRCLKEAPELDPKQFYYKLPIIPVALKEEEETTHLYVRRLLNNSRTAHSIPSDGERMAYAHQARFRGGTSTQIYLQSILENPDIIKLIEDAGEDNPASLLGRIARDTQITNIMKVRMRRPVLVIPGYQNDRAVKEWERYGLETKYFEIVMKVPIREITREEYDAIISAQHRPKKK